MDSPTATLIAILKERVEELRAEGNQKEALHAASATVEKCEQALSSDPESIVAFASALEIRAEIYRELDQLDSCAEDCKQAIDQLSEMPEASAQLGRIFALLGAVYDEKQDEKHALKYWRKSVECFEKCDPPLLMDVVAISNNMGFIYKSQGDFDNAETQFLRALEIMHEHIGREHEETATISSNLGALYQTAGYHEQAREMHMIALEVRRNILGDYHPDSAQSHNNLAMALLATGDRAWARRHFEKALAGFESMGEEYAEDLRAVVDNYCAFLREEGESKMAELIAERVSQELAQTA